MSNRQAYLRELRQVLRGLHRPEFAHLWTQPSRPGEWVGRYKPVQELAFAFATLYRFGGRRRDLLLARRYLLDFEIGHHFTSFFWAKTFAVIRPHLTRAQQDDLGRRWVRDVPAMLEKFVGNLENFAQGNTVSNHALSACVYADLARTLFPGLARPFQFQRTTDAVWKFWWARREFWEQASNYEGWSHVFHCAWAELRGVESEFYRSPTVQNMLLRGQQVVSPGGIVAAYGDSGHNEHATAWIACLERAAAKLRRGDAKTCARDIFECQRRLGWTDGLADLEQRILTNLANARLFFNDYSHALAYLALAAWWTDPKLKPAARSAVAGVIRRTELGYRLRPADKRVLPTRRLLDQQVALTGGPADPSRQTYLLLSVGRRLSHDHADAGAIHMLSCGDTVLLGTNGYLQRELLYHHLFFLQSAAGARYPEDREGKIFAGDPSCAGRILRLETARTSSYCEVVFEPYHGYPAKLTKQILVDHLGRVTVADQLDVGDQPLRGGPIYHGQRVRRLADRIYRLRTDDLRSMQGMPGLNPPGELEIQFLHGEGTIGVCRPALPAIYHAEVYRPFPMCHYTRVWRQSYAARQCLGLARRFAPGSTSRFVTHLVPRLGDRRP